MVLGLYTLTSVVAIGLEGEEDEMKLSNDLSSEWSNNISSDEYSR